MFSRCQDRRPERPPPSRNMRKRTLVKRRQSNKSLKATIASAFKAQYGENGQEQFRVEWDRLEAVVFDLYRSFERGVRGPEAKVRVPMQKIMRAHDDVQVLVEGNPGHFVFDVITEKILPEATDVLYQSILILTQEERSNILFTPEPYDIGVSRKFSLELLTLAWRQFYFEILPEIEIIFADVPGNYMSIRTAALLAFRDGIVGKVMEELIDALYDHSLIKNEIIFLRQMVLVLQNATQTCSFPECRFQIERLVPMVIKSYFPFLYPYGPIIGDGDEDVDYSSSHNESSDDDCFPLPICIPSSSGADAVCSITSLPNDNSRNEVNEPSVASGSHAGHLTHSAHKAHMVVIGRIYDEVDEGNDGDDENEGDDDNEVSMEESSDEDSREVSMDEENIENEICMENIDDDPKEVNMEEKDDEDEVGMETINDDGPKDVNMDECFDE